MRLLNVSELWVALKASTSSSRLSSSAALSPSCLYTLEASRSGRAQVVPTFRASVKYNSALCGFPILRRQAPRAVYTWTNTDGGHRPEAASCRLLCAWGRLPVISSWKPWRQANAVRRTSLKLSASCRISGAGDSSAGGLQDFSSSSRSSED